MRMPIALLLSLAAACAPSARTSVDTAPAVPRTATAAPASGLVGSYSVTLEERDLPGSVPQEARTSLVGAWTIAVHPGGHHVVMYNGRRVVEGSHQVTDDRIVLAAGETGEYACPMGATYRWRLADGQLTFTPVGEDPCPGRGIALTARPFARQP